jgi:hypothetical protein
VPAPARRRIAATLAAALFFLAFGLWSTGPIGILGRRPADPLLAQVMKHDVRLAAAQSARERLDALADLADVLQSDPRELVDAARAEELAALAQCYAKVVSEGIVPQAQTLRKEDQAADLDGIAARLLKAADDAETLARVRPEASAEPFKKIAQAARTAESQLPQHGVGAKAMHRASAPPVLFASMAWADSQGGPSAAARAELLRRDRALIEHVVTNSIRLAGAPDPLNRADACGELVGQLAEEIRSANLAGDTERVVELSQHLSVVVKLGFVANLTAARSAIPSGSNEEPRLQKVHDQITKKMQELEDALPAGDNALDDMSLTHKSVQEGHELVQKAIKWVKAGN